MLYCEIFASLRLAMSVPDNRQSANAIRMFCLYGNHMYSVTANVFHASGVHVHAYIFERMFHKQEDLAVAAVFFT